MGKDKDYFPHEDGTFEVKDIKILSETIRKEAVKEFNNLYKKDTLTFGKSGGIFKNPSRMSSKNLDKIITLTDIEDIVKEYLPYNSKTKVYTCTVELLYDCISKTARHIFYNVCETLTKAGIYKLCFDGDKEDFVWILTDKYKKKFEEEGKIVFDPNNPEDPNNSD